MAGKEKYVAMGYNLCNNKKKNSMHAEVDAIRNFIKKNKNYKYLFNNYDFTLIVIRVNKSKQMIMSKPCEHCYKILKRFNITNIKYSDEKGEIINLK